MITKITPWESLLVTLTGILHPLNLWERARLFQGITCDIRAFAAANCCFRVVISVTHDFVSEGSVVCTPDNRGLWPPPTHKLKETVEPSEQQNRTRITFSTVLGTPPNRTWTKRFPPEELWCGCLVSWVPKCDSTENRHFTAWSRTRNHTRTPHDKKSRRKVLTKNLVETFSRLLGEFGPGKLDSCSFGGGAPNRRFPKGIPWTFLSLILPGFVRRPNINIINCTTQHNLCFSACIGHEGSKLSWVSFSILLTFLEGTTTWENHWALEKGKTNKAERQSRACGDEGTITLCPLHTATVKSRRCWLFWYSTNKKGVVALPWRCGVPLHPVRRHRTSHQSKRPLKMLSPLPKCAWKCIQLPSWSSSLETKPATSRPWISPPLPKKIPKHALQLERLKPRENVQKIPTKDPWNTRIFWYSGGIVWGFKKECLAGGIFQGNIRVWTSRVSEAGCHTLAGAFKQKGFPEDISKSKVGVFAVGPSRTSPVTCAQV